MKVLVTGSTGFIGSHLVEELVSGHEVLALVRNPEKLRQFGFAGRIGIIRGDLFASEPFPADIEAVIHLAAITKATSPAEFIHVNQEGASSFLDRVRGLPGVKKVIQISSLAAAGPSGCDKPLTEEAECRPISLYGKSKLLEETVFRQKSPAPLITIRAPIVFGPRDYDMLDAFRLLRKGILPLLSREKRYFSIVYVKDLARGIITALQSPLGNELFFIANRRPIEWMEFMQLAARLLGREKIHPIRVPRWLGRTFAEISEWRCRLLKKRAIFNRDKFREMQYPCWLCSGEKMERLLHFTPQHDLEGAVAETVRWYQDAGVL